MENNTNNSVKINLVYEFEEQYFIESVWAENIGANYKINNIPFLAPNVALGDIVSTVCDEEDGRLYFDELIKPSGHSVIQVVFFDLSSLDTICGHLEKLGCGWEVSHISELISIDIPNEEVYNYTIVYLTELEGNKIIDYREACLGFK